MNYLCNGISESMKRDPNMKQIPLPLSESEFIELIQNVPFISVINYVEYKGRLNYSLLRFEKQSLEDLGKSKDILNTLIEVDV